MQFNDYQNKAYSFALPTAKNLSYLMAGLAGEVGELSSLYAKAIRDGQPESFRTDAIKELGDVLWFVSSIAQYLDHDLSCVAECNINKLQSRNKRGVIGGSGDNR